MTSPVASSATPQAGESELLPGRWIAMVVMLMAGFMNLIDVTIVNVAIPSLQTSLGASDAGIEWVVAAYIMAFALGLLPFGRLGDTMGRKRVFLTGVAGFTLASALCGLAPSIETLIAARVLQGIAGAMMTPQTLAIAQVIFPPRERGTAFALFGLTAGLAAVCGPIVGGLLIGADVFGLGWRPIFLVNIPVGIAAVVAGLRFIPDIAGERQLGIDFGGIALAGITIFLAVFPLIEGRGFGWPAWCFWMLAASIPSAWLFVRWQYRQARLQRPQLLPVTLLGNGAFMAGTAVSSVFFSAVPGFFFLFAIFLQVGFGFTPIQSGLTTVPFSLGVLLASILSGRLGIRWTRQRMAIGSVMLVASVVWLRLIAENIGSSIEGMPFLGALALGGIGLGTTVSPLFQSVLGTVSGRDAGSASGGVQAFQQVGGALGVTIMGQLFFGTLAAGTAAGLDRHQAFSDALGTGLIYSILAYSVVVIGAMSMPTPQGGGGHRAAPAPAEA
jgi:EmrB/QacA subfamily drug resistance transporter